MNFKENKENYYTKELNNLDRYLLRIIKRYFDLEELNNLSNINAIIAEAMARYKASIVYKNTGVNSINNKIGIINFDLSDLNGEQLFNKLTAFNKEFGIEQDTICMGNDERLSNKREPIYHHHKITDISILRQVLDEIQKELGKYGYHLHANINILNILKYSGTKTQIDLKEIESIGSIVNAALNILEFRKNDLINIYNSNKEKIEEILNQLYLFMERLYDYIDSSNKYINDILVNYIKEKINNLNTIKEDISLNYPNADILSSYANVINNSLYLITIQEQNIAEMLNINDILSDIYKEQVIDFSMISEDCIIDSIEMIPELVYNNTKIKIPYVTEEFAITSGIIDDNLYTKIQPLKENITLPTDIYNGKIIYNIYSKRTLI